MSLLLSRLGPAWLLVLLGAAILVLVAGVAAVTDRFIDGRWWWTRREEP